MSLLIARDAKQTRLLVKDGFDVLGRQLQNLEQVEDDAGVDGSGPRAHAQPVERGEPERAVDALAVPHRAQTRAAAQVRDDHPAARDLGRDGRQNRRDVLVREPVEAIALHAAAAEIARQRNDFGDHRLAAMEAGIETGDLGHAWQSLGHRIDRVEVVGLMERRERHQRAEIRHDLRRDDGRLRVIRAAVHDAMADAEHAGVTAVARAKPGSEGIERPTTVDAVFQSQVGQASAGLILGGESRRRSDAVDLTAHLHVPGAVIDWR